MANKDSLSVEASITRITVNGRRFYPGFTSRMVVRFTKTRVHCYLSDGTVLKKIHGGSLGGNYEGVENGDIYRVST